MDGSLYESIFKRKSFHLFRNVGQETIGEAEMAEIRAYCASLAPLFPDIRTEIRIVPAEDTTCRCKEEYCVLFFSEKKDGYLQNVGYMGEQLDLYLVSRGIGTLWCGMAKPKTAAPEGLDFVILIAIRRIDDAAKFRKDMFQSKRKPENEIWQGEPIDGVTPVVRFSPSACNTQPWFVKREGETLTVYRYLKHGKRGIMPAALVEYYNRVDIGIFLCILEVCLAHGSFAFGRELFCDAAGGCEYTKNAVYRLE